MEKVIISAAIFIFGAIIGSFLNVCIYRLPKGRSVVFPPSHCPKCDKGILWYDNIPLLSYILLGGRCRFCKGPISPRYFIVELLTAALLLSLFLFFGLTAKFLAYSILLSCLVVATFVDFEINEIPDEVSIGGMVAGVALAVILPGIFDVSSRFSAAISSALGLVVGGGSIYLMGLLGGAVFKKEAMGGGDVKIMAAIGAFLGWKIALLTFFIAPIFGAAVGVVLKLKDGRETIPYGPYLSLAALVSIFFGNSILALFFAGM